MRSKRDASSCFTSIAVRPHDTSGSGTRAWACRGGMARGVSRSRAMRKSTSTSLRALTRKSMRSCGSAATSGHTRPISDSSCRASAPSYCGERSQTFITAHRVRRRAVRGPRSISHNGSTVRGQQDDRRDAGEATTAAARKIWVLLELLRSGSVRFSTYGRLYHEAYRTFQRDLQHLRKIGATGGFRISPIAQKERAELLGVDAKLRSLDGSASVLGLLSALGGALGAPMSLELGDLATATADSGFLRLLVP